MFFVMLMVFGVDDKNLLTVDFEVFFLIFAKKS